MHRSYQSTKPCANKYLQQRWDEYTFGKHKDHLSNAKSKVDTSSPPTFAHLHVKAKKVQLEEERLAVIERDNRILLEKIASVMRSKGGIDNQNDVVAGSLNREKRQREMLRVTRENEQIIKRILSTHPDFDRKKLNDEWQDTMQTLDRMSHYPKDWWLTNKKESRMSRSKSETQRSQEPSEDGEDREQPSRGASRAASGGEREREPEGEPEQQQDAEKDYEADHDQEEAQE